MDDIYLKGEAVERFIYIVIILVLAGLITYVYFFRAAGDCEAVSPADDGEEVEEPEAVDETPTQEQKPLVTPPPKKVPTPTPSKNTTTTTTPSATVTSGKVELAILDIKSEKHPTIADYGKVTIVGIEVSNGRTTTLLAKAIVSVYDSEDDEDDIQKKEHLLPPIEPGTKVKQSILANYGVRRLDKKKTVQVDIVSLSDDEEVYKSLSKVAEIK